MENSSVIHRSVSKIRAENITETRDILAVEEPLEIRLVYGNKTNRIKKSISVTMRTPGSDAELAAGFLFTEGILSSMQDIVAIRHETSHDENIICVELHEALHIDLQKLNRNFYTTSSCGVCGKSSIEAVRTTFTKSAGPDVPAITPGLLYSLPALLRRGQAVFEHTGGLHASALFDIQGRLLLIREDVGRHNALDKVIGAAMGGKADIPLSSPLQLPLNRHILLLSGRASFELIQKAAMAGIKIVAAVGAPSSLAVEMAVEHEIMLAGFLQGDRFNIYSGADKISIGQDYHQPC